MEFEQEYINCLKKQELIEEGLGKSLLGARNDNRSKFIRK